MQISAPKLVMHSQRGNTLFPVWESFVPNVGTSRSQHGNNCSLVGQTTHLQQRFSRGQVEDQQRISRIKNRIQTDNNQRLTQLFVETNSNLQLLVNEITTRQVANQALDTIKGQWRKGKRQKPLRPCDTLSVTHHFSLQHHHFIFLSYHYHFYPF